MLSTTRRLLLCAAALALAAVAACGSASSDDRAATTPTPTPEPIVHPLTGVRHTGAQPWQTRPVLAVKIGNAGPERPQAGLDKADLVYEEIVEGGATRFMAVYSTNGADRLGPVRSARKVDPTLLAPLGALFAYSGGAPSTIRVIRSSSGFTDVGIDRASGAYYRDRSRSSPYNLYTSTGSLWSGRSGSPPQAQFAFLTPSDDLGAGSQEIANELTFSFAGTTQVRYAYDPATGLYTRHFGGSPHMAEGSVPLTYRNVIVQSVATSAGTSIDKAGFRAVDIQTTGSGQVVIVRGGKALRGTWERDTASEPIRFVDESGQEIRLAPGNTMIALLPQGRPVTVG